MKDFFKKPYNYFLLLVSIPALFIAWGTYESISTALRFGWDGGYSEDVMMGLVALLFWLVMWTINFLRDRSQTLKITGIILVILWILFLVILAPGH